MKKPFPTKRNTEEIIENDNSIDPESGHISVKEEVDPLQPPALDDEKIQFSLNGVDSEKFDISPGEYSFAVSLYHQWDSVKLLKYMKF